MALPSSGQISLNQIQIELGQSSGTQVSIGDCTDGTVATLNTLNDLTDIQARPDAFSDWYGYDHSLSVAGPPIQVFTYSAISISDGGATLRNRVISGSYYSANSRGVYYKKQSDGEPYNTGTNLSSNSTPADDDELYEFDTGNVLDSNTTYHFRAYVVSASVYITAIGGAGLVEFTTEPALGIPPTVTTDATVTGITWFDADCGGNVTDGGSTSVTARGMCWSTSTSPTIADDKTTDGTGTGTFSSTMTGLSPATLYYCRAYASNANGTSYGAQRSFTTQDAPT